MNTRNKKNDVRTAVIALVIVILISVINSAVEMVDEDDDILVITDDATIIRMAVEKISVLSRSTQGVRIMRLSEGSRVISIEKTDSEPGEEAGSDIPEITEE